MKPHHGFLTVTLIQHEFACGSLFSGSYLHQPTNNLSSCFRKPRWTSANRTDRNRQPLKETPVKLQALSAHTASKITFVENSATDPLQTKSPRLRRMCSY